MREYYINMDESLIEENVMKIPKMTIDSFMNKLKYELSEYTKWHQDYSKEEITIDYINNQIDGSIRNKSLASYIRNLTKRDVCLNDVYTSEKEFELISFDNGLVGLYILNWDSIYNESYPVDGYATFLYFDGEKMKIYFPKYGNVYNRKTNAPIRTGSHVDNEFVMEELNDYENPKNVSINLNAVLDAIKLAFSVY